jgi:hypothetical protein
VKSCEEAFDGKIGDSVYRVRGKKMRGKVEKKEGDGERY